MRIADALGPGPGKPPVISFEFFPRRTPEAERRLYDTVAKLAPQDDGVDYSRAGESAGRDGSPIARLFCGVNAKFMHEFHGRWRARGQA